jgi:hypothetical protein
VTEEELRALIALGRENRRIEFKRSMRWSDAATQGKITKSILGMSNIRDGGIIVIGVNRQPDGSYQPAGVSAGDLKTYDPDHIGRCVQNFADPIAVFSVQRIVSIGIQFIVIEVSEFPELPVICKADGPEGLVLGAMYTRNSVPETIRVPSQTEMREIVEMAVDKGIRKHSERLTRAGIVQTATPVQPSQDQQRFQQELEEIDE